MSLRWVGDDVRRNLGVRELQAAGLSQKAAEALADAGVFTVRELLRAPWSDEEAGARFASLKWRLSVGPHPSRVVSQIEQRRAQLLEAA
jgi:hypothetical protein